MDLKDKLTKPALVNRKHSLVQVVSDSGLGLVSNSLFNGVFLPTAAEKLPSAAHKGCYETVLEEFTPHPGVPFFVSREGFEIAVLEVVDEPNFNSKFFRGVVWFTTVI